MVAYMGCSTAFCGSYARVHDLVSCGVSIRLRPLFAGGAIREYLPHNFNISVATAPTKFDNTHPIMQLPGMVNVTGDRCEHRGCNLAPTYGLPRQVRGHRSFLSSHAALHLFWGSYQHVFVRWNLPVPIKMPTTKQYNTPPLLG